MQKSKKQSKKTRIVRNKEVISHPPTIDGFNVIHSTKLRFSTNAAFAGDITFQNLLDCIVFSTTATVLKDLFLSVKVRKVEVWGIAAIGTATSVTVAFDGQTIGLVGNQVTKTDTSMGIEPAHVLSRPAQKSQASQFQLSSANSAFFLDCPSGSVVDVSLSYKSSTTGQTVGAQNAGVGLTVGAIFWRGLDGVALATSKFVLPLGIAQA